jgi:hypothetical protein
VFLRILIRKLPFCAKAVVAITKKSAARVLSEGGAGVTWLYREVRVADGRGGEENKGACRKLDNHFQVPEYQMAALRGIEVSEGLNSTHAEGDIEHIVVAIGPDVGTEIKGSA